MATKEMYLVFTRFYKGEDECPAATARRCNNGEYLWGIERDWVSECLRDISHSEYIEEYIRYVNPMVNSQYGIPVSLLAYIFHRISKWQNSIEDWGLHFNEFIEKQYMS